MKKEKSCGAVIFNTNQEYLIVGGKGFFGFPKGHMEGNESEEETALREIKEETDLDVELIKGFRAPIKYKIPAGTDKEVVFFLAKPKKVDVRISDELDEYHWLEFEAAYKLLSRENLKDVLKKAQEFLKK